MEEKSKKKEFLSWVSCLALALVFALAVRFFIGITISQRADNFQTPQISMQQPYCRLHFQEQQPDNR